MNRLLRIYYSTAQVLTTKGNKVLSLILGEPSKFSSETLIIMFGLILAVLTNLIGLIINASLFGVNFLTFLTIVGTVFYLSLLILARFTPDKSWVKWTLTLSLYIYVDILWIENFGSNGPILYIYILMYSLYVFVFNSAQRFLMISLYVTNTVAMFLLEYFKPELFSSYTSGKTRLIDVYSGIVIYIIIVSVLMGYIKRIYIQEKDKAQESDRLKSAFLANLSHEIRTPMNSIVGFSQLLEKNLTPEKRKQYLNSIQQNGNYLVQLIDDIIDISTIEAGGLVIHKTYFPVQELFENLYGVFSEELNQTPHQNIDLTYSVSPDDIAVYTDAIRLHQILSNLLANSMKFTHKGFVRFACTQAGNNLLFEVSDSGIGIDSNNLSLIFQRFYKIETDHTRLYPGTGIGLSITQELVHKLGGRIWVNSELSKGTTFRFTIPYEKYVTQGDRLSKKND